VRRQSRLFSWLLKFGVITWTVCQFIVVDGQTLHGFYVVVVGRVYPPQQAKEEYEEDDERDHRPNLDVLDALQYILVHDGGY
jgi:hypothetical protein